MKRITWVPVAIALALVLALALPAAASPKHPFRGNWKGIDLDGSHISLWIVEEGRSGGKVFQIRGYDDRTGLWCGGPARMSALGALTSDTTIDMHLIWWCLPAADSWWLFLPDTLTYDPATDTLFDGSGVVYSRTP
jgi:hypothetical protein